MSEKNFFFTRPRPGASLWRKPRQLTHADHRPPTAFLRGSRAGQSRAEQQSQRQCRLVLAPPGGGARPSPLLRSSSSLGRRRSRRVVPISILPIPILPILRAILRRHLLGRQQRQRHGQSSRRPRRSIRGDLVALPVPVPIWRPKGRVPPRQMFPRPLRLLLRRGDSQRHRLLPRVLLTTTTAAKMQLAACKYCKRGTRQRQHHQQHHQQH